MDDQAEFSGDGCLFALFQSFAALWLWRWAERADREWTEYAAAAAAEDSERFERLLAAIREERSR